MYIATNEEITMRNILIDMLTYSSKKYNTKRDLIIKSQELYAASLSTGIFKTVVKNSKLHEIESSLK